MSGPGQGNAHASGGLLTAPRPSAPYQRAAPRYKGFCEIAISPFDTSQLVHASDGDRRSQKHDVVRLPPPEHVSDASWIRHTTNVRLISGCTVLMERDIASNVDHMHMLQWRPCGDARTDLILTQFVSPSLECSTTSTQRHTIISSPHPLASCAFVPASSPHLIIVTTAAIYEVALKKESVNAGSFLKVEITQRFPLRPRAAIPSAGHLSSPIAASGIADCVPMLFVTGCEWQLSFFQDNGRIHFYDKSSNEVLPCASPAPPPSAPPAPTWMGSLIAVLPFGRQASAAPPQPVVAAANILDAVNCTFTCTVYNGNDQIESIFVPRPEEVDPDYGTTPDGVPDSACITCTTDGGVLCVAAAWVMPLHKTHVRSIFLCEDPQSPGKLISEEVFTENPKSSLHAVSSLSIQCNKLSNRLCIVGSNPPAQSHSNQVDLSRKHVTAIEILRMRKQGNPAGAPTCKVVHGLSSQMRDDINALQTELREVVDQRVKAVPRSGELHAVGNSGSISSIFVQFLRRSQWWQHFPSRLDKVLPSHQPFGDDWASQAAQVILRPQTRPVNHQSKKSRIVGSDSENDSSLHMHGEILNYVEQVFDQSMCTLPRTAKSTGRVFPCDDLPYTCVSIDSTENLFQPLLSGCFFIVKSAYVCAVVESTQDIRSMVPPSVNLKERQESRKEHSRLFLYPPNMFNYAEDFDGLFKASIMPAAGSLHDVMGVNMPCDGFKAFVSDSLLGYFYSARHNVIQLLRVTEDGSAGTDSGVETMQLLRQNERFYGLLRQLASVVIRTESHQCSALSVLDAAWHACLRSSSSSDKTLMRLVTLACFKLLSPFLPSPSSGSSVNSIPMETLRACQIFTKLVDLNYGATAQEPSSLLAMVRFVLAVRNVDGVSAQKFACSLLMPSGAPIDPFNCYSSVRLILLASNMTSELCDILSALLQSCKTNGQVTPKDLFEDVFSAHLDCARLTRPGGALQLLFDYPSLNPKEYFERIIHRAIILRRFDVLRDSLVAQHALDFFKDCLADKWPFWNDSGPHGDQNREALVRAAFVHCLDPSRKDQHESRYVAAACSLRMAKAKFESKKYSAALQHADAALNCIKILREKTELSGLQTETYALLPAISPESQELPANWTDGQDHCIWPQHVVTRCVIVLGRESLCEADLRLFCAVLRTIALLESDEANQGYLESMLSGATLAGLHVFSLSFYKKLINYDGREHGILANSPRWLSGMPGFIQVLESAFDIMVAYYQLPHGQAISPPLDAVSRLSKSLCDPRDASPEKLPEHFVRICVQCIHSALKEDASMASKFDCFAWLSQIIARLECILENTPPLLSRDTVPCAWAKYSLGFFHQVAVTQMAAIGVVPPYDFVLDGMGSRNSSSELSYENNNVGNMALTILKVSPEMAELILARFLEWVLKRMGVAPGRSYENVVSLSSEPSAFEAKSAFKNSTVKIGMGRLLLVPAGSFEVLGLVKSKSRQHIHVPESIIELTPPKMKLEENYKLYKLVSYMASLLYRKWISSSDSKTFMASCSDQNGINVASSPYTSTDGVPRNFLNEIVEKLRQAVPK